MQNKNYRFDLGELSLTELLMELRNVEHIRETLKPQSVELNVEQAEKHFFLVLTPKI